MRYGPEQQSEARQDQRYAVSDIQELRNRLVVVEDQVARLIDESATTRAIAAMADRDIADFRQEMRGHTRVLNALRQTQIEHGQTLERHSGMLDRHTTILDRHSATLDRHTTILDQHTETLDRHSAILDKHTATLDQHTTTLDQHTTTLDEHGDALTTLVAGQAAIMRHLGIAESGEAGQRQE